LDRIAGACGTPLNSLQLEGVSGVRFAPTVTTDYKKLNCVMTKIRETYYPGTKVGVVGNEKYLSERDHAQTH